MNKYWWVPIIVIFGAVVVLSFLRANKLQTELIIAKGSIDTVDGDFMASISRTGDPYVFDVRVLKTNRKARKVISGWPVQVDFQLTNKDGVIISSEYGGGVLAEDISGNLDDMIPPTTVRQGKVRLRTQYIAPGKYLIEPVVRIIEKGEDRVSGCYADGGSVAIPSGKRLWITIPANDAEHDKK